MTRGTVQREQIYVYDTCEKCSAQNVLVYECGEQLLCAEHARQYAYKNPPLPYCDNCGAQRAVFRDPSHRKNIYLCSPCHFENGGIGAKDSVVGRMLRAMFTPPKKVEKIRCYAAGVGSDCDANVKPRSAWGGKMLCNTHGRIAPKKEKK